MDQWEREFRERIEAAFDFLVTEHDCRKRGRFIAGGMEIFYWNAATAVRVLIQARDEFVVYLCPRPEGRFPPETAEWYDAFDAVKLVTGRRPSFTPDQLYGNDPAVVAAYAAALPSLLAEQDLWPRLRRQRRARVAYRRSLSR